MSLSLTLDVAISLVFIYVLGALLASTVSEMLAGVLKLRGVYLTKSIESLTSLGKNNEFSWGGFRGWAYAHFWQSNARVTGLDEAAHKAAEAALGATAADPVATVRAAVNEELSKFHNFRTLRDAISAAATVDEIKAIIRPVGAVAALQKHPMLVGTPSSLPSYVPARDFATALLGVLMDGSSAPSLGQARATIEKLPDGDMKTTLLSFIDAGANTLNDLRARIETWFDDAMERVAGIYKRSAQYVMLVLGLLIAVGMNVDSIHAVRTLWSQPTLSNAVASGASHIIKDTDFAACLDTGGARDRPASPDTKDAPSTPACKPPGLMAIQHVIDQEDLPIGRKPTDDLFGCSAGGSVACGTINGMGWTMLGWLISAFAISLGAQFWFDLLTKLTNLRAAGPKPDQTTKAT